MKKLTLQKNIKDTGFTLVETLVAIAILMVAIAGPLTVAEKSLSAAIYARDQLMASYLAQDAMEYIKNTVDTNQISIRSDASLDAGDYWITYRNQNIDLSHYCGYDPATKTGNVCTIDTLAANDPINQCGAPGECQPLIISSSIDNGSNGYVQSGDGQPSPFTRYFYVVPFTVNSGGNGNGGTDNAANIVVDVTWPGDVTGGGGVTIEDTLFDASI